MNKAAQSIVVTVGEPAGIGAEITLGAWLRLRETDCAFYLLHDPTHASELAQTLSLHVPVKVISTRERRAMRSGELCPSCPSISRRLSGWGSRIPATLQR
jgi:4-hydroxy-L-threonine phosphate dehydrogenase PdxA